MITEERWSRFNQLLTALEALGLTQVQIATRIGVSPKYISDIKNMHRGLTELTARRFADEFGVSFEWLLFGQGSMKRVVLSDGPKDFLSLPLLDVVHIGPPLDCPSWLGTWTNLAGAAALAANRSKLPYILRMPNNDREGQLNPGDLLLVSQEPTPASRLAIVSGKPNHILARKNNHDSWIPIKTGMRITWKTEVLASIVGIVWKPF